MEGPAQGRGRWNGDGPANVTTDWNERSAGAVSGDVRWPGHGAPRRAARGLRELLLRHARIKSSVIVRAGEGAGPRRVALAAFSQNSREKRVRTHVHAIHSCLRPEITVQAQVSAPGCTELPR